MKVISLYFLSHHTHLSIVPVLRLSRASAALHYALLSTCEMLNRLVLLFDDDLVRFFVQCVHSMTSPLKDL